MGPTLRLARNAPARATCPLFGRKHTPILGGTARCSGLAPVLFQDNPSPLRFVPVHKPRSPIHKALPRIADRVPAHVATPALRFRTWPERPGTLRAPQNYAHLWDIRPQSADKFPPRPERLLTSTSGLPQHIVRTCGCRTCAARMRATHRNAPDSRSEWVGGLKVLV